MEGSYGQGPVFAAQRRGGGWATPHVWGCMACTGQHCQTPKPYMCTEHCDVVTHGHTFLTWLISGTEIGEGANGSEGMATWATTFLRSTAGQTRNAVFVVDRLEVPMDIEGWRSMHAAMAPYVPKTSGNCRLVV